VNIEMYKFMRILRGGELDGPIVTDLTVELARGMVDSLQTHIDSGDDEAHHTEHDMLMELVLTCVAEGRCIDPAGCARVALEPFEHDMQRWCA
jgi:hypothetical protein